MKYKALGFLVWNGGRWYLRRRYGDTPKKLFAGGVIAALFAGAAGAAVAQRRASKAAS
jgi:hypothetical protein